MEPKFQSSFIPKSPIATTGTATRISRGAGGSFLATLALIIFIISVALSAGVFGYELYLNSHIGAMSGALTAARASLEPDSITAISRLDARIVSTGVLLDSHIVLSPLFDYLENSTLKNVRFTEFGYQSTDQGLELTMRGQARGYAAVALQAQIFNKSPYMKSPVFSNLDLDALGNVTFSFMAHLDPSIVSYKKLVDDTPAAGITAPLPSLPAALPVSLPASTSTSTSTPGSKLSVTSSSTPK